MGVIHGRVANTTNNFPPIAVDDAGRLMTVAQADEHSPMLDAFGRQRMASPETVFDSKQLHDAQPLLWDDAETSGGGTGSSHSTAHAATTISVGNTTAGTRVRQTFRRFNYQPGKSQLVLMTFTLGAAATGITRRVGLFDANNGLFLEQTSTGLRFVRRTNYSGTPSDTSKVEQASWNIDPMDGTGPSGVTLDASKSQILLVDYEWLGVGTVRMGFVIDGAVIYAHQFTHANSAAGVYMSTPNLPLRYEISNGGTGAAATLETICSTVISEGGRQDIGVLRAAVTGAISALANTATYALLGIRLKSTHLDASVMMELASAISSTANDQFQWSLRWNPTVATTGGAPFTYGDQTNSAVQTATGHVDNTVTGGYIIAAGFATTAQPMTTTLRNALMLGSTIAGTADRIVLCVTPITNNITVRGALTWRELQ